MKVIVELSKEDLAGYRVTAEEMHDWIEQALSRSVETWDGGLAFLDGPCTEIVIKEI